MKKTVLSILVISLLLMTGCDNKTEKLNNSQDNPTTTSSSSTTTTTTTTESTTTTSSTTTTRKKVIKQTQTTTSKIIYSTTKSTRKIPIAKYPDEDENGPGRMVTGYKMCDSDNECTCYFEGETPYSCE